MTQRGRGGARPSGRADARRRDAAEPRVPALPRVDLTAAKARIRALIEPVIADAGYDLEDVAISRAGRRHVVRVLVDTDGGISLDDVAIVSREISTVLDAADESGDEVLPGEYQLEVGSPGVDRPLTLPRHWRRNITRLVTVDGLTGRVTEVGDDGVVLDVDGTPHTLTFAELGPGKVQIEFKRLAEAQFPDEEFPDEELSDDEDDEDDHEGEGGE